MKWRVLGQCAISRAYRYGVTGLRASPSTAQTFVRLGGKGPSGLRAHTQAARHLFFFHLVFAGSRLAALRVAAGRVGRVSGWVVGDSL